MKKEETIEFDTTKIYTSPSKESIAAYVDGEWKQFLRTDIVADLESKKEQSIECPYCDGQGWTSEHNHEPDQPCTDCPIQLPCGYCYADGRVTTKLMKEHIAQCKTVEFNEDDLPF